MVFFALWKGLGAKLGLIGDFPVTSKQSCLNRQNPKIYKAYTYVLDDDEVYTNIGRFGFMRPTKGNLSLPLVPRAVHFWDDDLSCFFPLSHSKISLTSMKKAMNTSKMNPHGRLPTEMNGYILTMTLFVTSWVYAACSITREACGVGARVR